MNHHFNTDVAEKYGIEEAILFENIYYWCIKNKANNHNFFDGNYWTYNSVKAFSDMFKYMNPKKITAALKNLEESGLITSGCYNENKYDRTKWYAITDFGYSIYQNREMDNPKTENRNTNNGQMIVTDINQIINTNIKPDRETENMIHPKSGNDESNFSASGCIQSECLDEQRKTYVELHKKWVQAGLPLSKSSANDYFTFSCRELKSALGEWLGMKLAPDDYTTALDNYIELARLIKSKGSWMKSVGGFDYFAKHILDFLDGNFDLDKYRSGDSEEKEKPKELTYEERLERTKKLMEKYGIKESGDR